MGNQISKKKRSPERKVDDTIHESCLDYTSDHAHSDSSCQPKFFKEYDYIFPHTVAEANRQQGQHYLFKHIFQASFFAPVDVILQLPTSKVLDIGCGTSASWIIDMANDFPQSTFYGVDIIQPFSLSTDISTSHIPPNCVFEKADVLDGLAFESNTFDYIHQRMMYNAYPEDHIGFVFQEIKRVLKPNGWVELVDGDINPKNAGPKFTFLMEAVKKFLNSKLGAVFHAPLLQKTLIGIGLQDVSTDYGSVPICWGGIVGKQFYEDLLQVFNHIGTSIFHLLELGDTYDKSVYEDFLDSAFDECAEYQTFFNVRWAHGRLPEEVLE